MDLTVRARDYTGRLAPRPLLVIGGELDHTVPAKMAEELFHAAREPKELYVIPGADHGDYVAKGGATYEAKLVEFFDRSL